jgi:hypothetical protein
MSSKTDAEWFTCRLAIVAKNFEGSEKKLDRVYHNVASSKQLGKNPSYKDFLNRRGRVHRSQNDGFLDLGPAYCEVGCQPLLMPASSHAGKRKQKPFSRTDGGEAMSKKVLKMPR